jgi:uncharacterized phiE125 gp8 family phage protein
MAWQVITAPDSEPLTLADAKAQLRVDGSDDDPLIASLIAEAREYVERTCNRALMPQTWRLRRDHFGAGVLMLSGGPFRGIVSVTYRDPAGAEQVLPNSDYIADLAEPARIQPVTQWPATANRIDAVTIEADVGYATAAAVPAPIKRAILMLITHWYENRAAVNVGNITSELPLAVDALLFPYRDGGMH